MGGDCLREVGGEVLFDIKEHGVMGFAEIVCKLPALFKLKKAFAKVMEERKPDCLVVVDYPGFNMRLAKLAKAKGIHTTLDTSANPFTREEPFISKFNELMKYTDLVMLDIKNIDREGHKKLTGQTVDNILDCAKYLDEIGKEMWIRHVLVPDTFNLSLIHI